MANVNIKAATAAQNRLGNTPYGNLNALSYKVTTTSSGAVAGSAGRLRYGCDGHSLPQKAQPVTNNHWLTHSPGKLPAGSFLGFLSPCIRRAVVRPSAQGPKFSSDKRFEL